MTNLQLEQELKSLVRQERELLHEILLRNKEVDVRKLYLERGYSSLFEYLTQEIGYSNASAQRRIDTVRLAQEIPDVIEQVREGELNLTQIGQAQRGFRRTEITTEEKRELLSKLAYAPAEQAEAIVARELDLPVVQKTRLKPQANGSVRMEVTLSEEGHVDLLKVKELLSHVIPSGEVGAVLEKALRFYLEKQAKKPTSGAEVKSVRTSELKPAANLTSGAEVNPRKKSIPMRIRRATFQRDQCCQFKSDTGKICGSRHQLEIDHIQMRYHGGTNEPENLRLLCRRHNQWLAERIMAGEAIS